MGDNLIISISREYGSGGREIAEKLAAELDIAYYDRLLIAKIAQESGFSDDVIESYDEKPIDRFLLNPNRFLAGIDIGSPIASEVYKSEVSILNKAADEGPCVIVGRCADSVLAERPGLVRVFISAPLPDRLARVMRRNNIDEKTAKARIAKIDKARAGYHNHFSNRNWGDASLYDLCLDSERLDIAGSVELILEYLRIFTTEHPNVSMPGK